MNETAHNSIIATVSTPTTINTQPSSGVLAGFIDFLSKEVPLLDSLGVGAVIVALIAGWFQTRIRHRDREHEKELEKLRMDHAIKLQSLTVKLETEVVTKSELRALRIERLKEWRQSVETGNFNVYFTEGSEYGSLRPLLKPDVREYIEESIERIKKLKPIRFVGYGRDTHLELTSEIRALLVEEMGRIEKEWDLI